MASSPASFALDTDTHVSNGRSLGRRSLDASSGVLSVSNIGVGAKKQLVEPEVIALNELLDTFPSEIDDTQEENEKNRKRKKMHVSDVKIPATYCLYEPRKSDKKDEDREEEREEREEENNAKKRTDRTFGKTQGSALGSRSGGGHPKLSDLTQRVRDLERDNLHLKQALLLGKNAAERDTTKAAVKLGCSGHLGALSRLAGLRGIGARGTPGVEERANGERLLAERTKVVTEMVEHLNATFLSLGDASRVWHEDCRVSAGVREWDAFGRLQTISLWNMIRSVFKNIVVDIVELRPHLPDGEMILTKWRIQGEVASAQHLKRVCASVDCPVTMRVALMAIKSSDLTFTVTTYIVFDDLHIAEQHHCWDQVGVFKRLFGGEIPPMVQKMLIVDEDTVAGRKQPLDV